MLRTTFSAALLVYVAFSPVVAAQGSKPLYLDPSQSFEKRTRDLISRLTLEEKATLLDHDGPDCHEVWHSL